MPGLMISPAPTPLPASTGSASALGQGETGCRSDECATTDAGSAAESTFAATLKSRMNKKAAAGATESARPASTPEPPLDPAVEEISFDLSALLPLIGASAVTSAQATTATETTATNLDDKPLPALPGIEAGPPEVRSALPEASVQSASLPVIPIAVAPPRATPTSIPSTRADNTSPPAKDVPAPPAEFAKPEDLGRNPGKIAFDAAINADAAPKNDGAASPDAPANDFRTLMDRAMTTAAMGETSAGESSSSGGNLRVATPLGQAGWHDEMGQKLTWMVGNNRQHAELVLTPPQLGRVEVSLTLSGDQATAVFTSPNPSVREALENSLHRLREVLADAGVSLGQTQVGSESPNRSTHGDDSGFGSGAGVRYATRVPLPEVAARSGAGAGRGMIDIFA